MASREAEAAAERIAESSKGFGQTPARTTMADMIDAQFAGKPLPSIEDRLRELEAEMKTVVSDPHRLIVEGRMMELTRGLDCCPEWWHYPCECDECLSCGE